MARVGVGIGIPWRRWNLEVGYNRWVWGRSARQYREPYISVGHLF
jgi:hypothetical protein